MNQSQFDATLGLEGKKLQMNQQQFMDNLALQRENLAAQQSSSPRSSDSTRTSCKSAATS